MVHFVSFYNSQTRRRESINGTSLLTVHVLEIIVLVELSFVNEFVNDLKYWKAKELAKEKFN